MLPGRTSTRTHGTFPFPYSYKYYRNTKKILTHIELSTTMPRSWKGK